MKRFFKSGLILLGVFSHALVFSQAFSGRIIKKYGITEGLSQAVVNSITQDDKGLMWFATDDGLNRFDGYSFTTFKFDTHSTNRFHDNFVQSVWKDNGGTLWVSSRRGLNKFDLSKEQFVPYIDEQFPEGNDVSFISQGSSDNLWLAFYGGGFASFDRQTEKITTYNPQTLTTLSTVSSIVTFEDSYGLIWVGSQDKGLNVFKVKNGKTEKALAELSGVGKLPSLYVKCIEEDHLGNIWIGTTKGLALFIRQDNQFQIIQLTSSATEGKGVFSLHEDSNKTLWIGSHGEGLYSIDLKEFDGRHLEELNPQHIKSLDKFSISHLTVRAIFEDKDKNLWFGTSGDGIFMIGNEVKDFFTIRVQEIINGAENFVSFNGMCNDKDGFIWAGTNGDGIYKLHKNGQVIRHYAADGNKGSIKENVVISAYRDHEDNLWFGTYSSGMFLYDKQSDSFIHYPHELSAAAVPLASNVRVIFEDSKKNLWIGAARAGICVADKISKNFKYYAGNDHLKNVDARAFAEDKEGALWIGCYGNGLIYFDQQTNKFASYFQSREPDNALKSNIIYALAFDKNNRLWIGSGGGGLGVYDTKNKTLKRYSVADGLINNTIYGLLIDDAGKIWVSTIMGISKFDPETEQFFNYTYADGLQEGQFNIGSSLSNVQQGYMCFGGALGLNLFDPSKVKHDAKTPKVMISGFQLFNSKVGVGNTKDGLLSKVIDETKKITLKHDQSVFAFEFTALNYNYPQKNKYAYKLEGLDHEWNYSGNSRTATYRYLRPGNYQFKVKATSQDNTWPEEFASIDIEVLPPFWKTPVAYLLYFLTTAAIAYAIYMIRKKEQFLNKRLRIERTFRTRQRHLVQEKLSFFTEVSHEFRTPLTLIIGPLEEILTREGNYTAMGKKLKMVYKNAHKLLNLINKLLDYRKVETGNMVLRVKENNIVSFCEEIYITFRELAIRKNIKFEFHAEHPSILTWFDKEKLEMVLNNILSNSFKYIGHGNAITLTISKQHSDTKENIIIEIKDDGIGIPKEQLRYIFDWYYQADNKSPVSSGIGLALAKKLVYLHKGQIHVTSEVGQGSVFTIKIPIGKEHFKSHEIVVDERDDSLISVPGPAAPLDEDNNNETDHVRKRGLKSVLIVEDDDDVRNFLKDYFENRYKIYEAKNGKEGLELAEEFNPDLIISDIMMPEMNGIDFCKRVKNVIKTSHIPVVLLTAKTSFTHHKEGLEIGADAYVTKPFSPEMLGLTVENLLQSQENLMRFYRSRFIRNGTDIKAAVSLDEKLLQRVYEFVQVNLNNTNVNLDDVCEELNMGRSLLYKKIKSLTGLSPVEYIRSLRLGEAASLLKTQKYKVFEVVYMVGFSDIKYFRQCFQKEFGYPPSSLLEKQGEG